MGAAAENRLNFVKDESFRDRISTVDSSGKRVWVYPKKPKGKFTNYRTVVAVILLVTFFSLPFIKLNGAPLFMLNFLERKFIIFGMTFWPQDFHIFLLASITFMVFVVLFTVVYGRIFCGWVCPQTIFMEMVFRKIEYWIEGDYKKQKALDKQKTNSEKVFKKSLKHVVFFAISFVIANIFLMYIISADAWWVMVNEPVSQHLGGLTSLLVFTGAFYGVFAKLREQVCTTICPYGRLQGVLLDRNSVVIAYDYLRGEKRAKFRKKEDRETAGKGDCIDCHQCVDVCPTGIDIRDGLQMECINCTACMDACDFVMDKINKPRGLIKYASEKSIADGDKFRFTTRVKAYTAVLLVLAGLLVSFTLFRSDTETTILRAPGQTYKMEEENIVNVFSYTILNKTHDDLPLEMRLMNSSGTLQLVNKEEIIHLNKEDKVKGIMFIKIPQDQITKAGTDIEIGIYSEGKLLETAEARFMGPIRFN